MTHKDRRRPEIEYLRKLLGNKTFLPDTPMYIGSKPLYITGGFWPKFIYPHDQETPYAGLANIHYQVPNTGSWDYTRVRVEFLSTDLRLMTIPMIDKTLKASGPLTLEDYVFKMPMGISHSRPVLIVSGNSDDLVAKPRLDVDITTIAGIQMSGSTFKGTKEKIVVANFTTSGYKVAQLSISSEKIEGIGGHILAVSTAQEWVERIISFLIDGLDIKSDPEFGSRNAIRASEYSLQTVHMLNMIGVKIADQRGESYRPIDFVPAAVKPTTTPIPPAPNPVVPPPPASVPAPPPPPPPSPESSNPPPPPQ